MYNDLDTNNRVYLIFCDISNYRHWVNESINAEKFFNNLDKLKSALAELCEIEYPYDTPPSEQLEEIIQNEQKIIQDFLSRSWISVISESKKLKTNKGRYNRISSFFNDISPYGERFSEETLKMIEKAKSSEPDLNLSKVTKQEKDILFLNSTEKALSIHDEIIDNLPTSNGNYAWLYNNKIIFYKIIGNNIPDYILIDIIKLMLSNYNYNKAARFIKLKYGLNRNYAIEVYVTAETIKHNSVEIKSLKRKYDYYKIDTHASPCPICKKKVGEIHRFSEAIIGETYPPFCRHNCSNALPLIK